MTEPDFYTMTEDILEHPLFQQLRAYPHHGAGNTVYDHSVSAAQCAFHMAQRFHMRPERVEAVTRAALLHDFFGYSWQSEEHRRYMRRYSGWQRFTHMHAFIHGPHAANRADRVFGLDQRQKDAIASHMFPLAPFPKNSEAWVVTLADKVVATREMGRTAWQTISRQKTA